MVRNGQGFESSHSRQCKFCSEIFKITRENRRKQFCNHSCAAKFTNKFRKAFKKCLGCDKDTYEPKTYCSKSCWIAHKSSLIEARIKKGDISDRKTLRNFFIKKFGHNCLLCGLTTWKDERIPLVLDHIDGNADNNKMENLRMICPNCDALLPTYMGRNKGNGRAYRRELYKQGKHYR